MRFIMNDDQLTVLLDACDPVPLIAINVGTGLSRQERANNAWRNLGLEMGFDSMTVQPTGEGDKYFTATSTKEFFNGKSK